MLYSLLRRALFALEPETSHDFSLALLEYLKSTPLNRCLQTTTTEHPVEIMGLRFKNPVGLAAGLDKNGDYIAGLAQFGFGFIEIGTTTPVAQPGNPKPRMFRIPEQHAIINRMGFNNKGVDYLLERVKTAKQDCILGINIGKNKATANEKALDDYLFCLHKVYPLADYITINISSPNTPGLRDLQHINQLKILSEQLKQHQAILAEQYQRYVPVLIKIAPDIDTTEVIPMCEIFIHHQIDGLIISNTTLDRPNLDHHPIAQEAGGLSGKPLLYKSTQTLQQFTQQLKQQIPVIGVGGIMCAEDAIQKIQAGASLVQIYSGFIYHGPQLISDINKTLQHYYRR